ncbi:hypothetical protein MOQ_002801 [Trypanosoma cruzi marinkellei]|uniref:Uncharacterized protein n=1 Tax=Trypanosoma cruzi marinkellei TaxID=85056 RepID=K2N1J2_TRYCR|nr:hypothetical protein MOQ_002801 [Trypanosoma cruzi marinkellei]
MSEDDDESCGVTNKANSSSSTSFSSLPDGLLFTENSGTWISRLVCIFFARLASGEELLPLIRHFRTELLRPTQASLGARATSFGKLEASVANTTTDVPGTMLQGSNPRMEAMGVVSEQDKLFLYYAAKVALLLSAESEKAQDEATRLLCEPVVAQALQLAANQGDAIALPLSRKYDFFLSSRVAVCCARWWAREGRWDVGLRLLERAVASPMTTAAAVELFSHAGRWEMAVRCLGQLPPTLWTEIEVSAAVRSLYRAVEGPRRNGMKVGDVPNAGLWRIALHILTLVRDNKVRLSAPSAVNDALGLLGTDGQQWVMACRLVKTMLLNSEKEGLTGESSGTVRPNVVSIYHMCRAVRQHWHVALQHASLMIREGDICISDDREVTDRLLKACVVGNRWVEALLTVQKSLESNPSKEGRDCIHTDVFLRFLKMLHERQKGFIAAQLFQQPQLSRHFSKDTTGKAYNVMLRYCNTVSEARVWLQTMGTKNILVENESYEHLMILYAREGVWQQALSLFNALLTDPQRQRLYIPCAKAHDAVQYALERVSPPGPSWEVSVTLFTRMCDLNVPISEVAFQSVVKKCFSQGKADKAQSLFRFVVRHGVRR